LESYLPDVASRGESYAIQPLLVHPIFKIALALRLEASEGLSEARVNLEWHVLQLLGEIGKARVVDPVPQLEEGIGDVVLGLGEQHIRVDISEFGELRVVVEPKKFVPSFRDERAALDLVPACRSPDDIVSFV
jgi:hypothetical protein